MPTQRRTASKTKTSTQTRVKAQQPPAPGTVQKRETASQLKTRVANLEKAIDLHLIRFAVVESTLEAAMERIRQLQEIANKDLLGL